MPQAQGSDFFDFRTLGRIWKNILLIPDVKCTTFLDTRCQVHLWLNGTLRSRSCHGSSCTDPSRKRRSFTESRNWKKKNLWITSSRSSRRSDYRRSLLTTTAGDTTHHDVCWTEWHPRGKECVSDEDVSENFVHVKFDAVNVRLCGTVQTSFQMCNKNTRTT